jgi:hypothetical protein
VVEDAGGVPGLGKRGTAEGTGVHVCSLGGCCCRVAGAMCLLVADVLPDGKKKFEEKSSPKIHEGK